MALHLTRVCGCGHAKDAHEHYRRGTDCSACECARYRGGFHLTLSVRVAAPAPETAAVVVPDEVAQVAGPYVRPAHTAGIGGRPVVAPGLREVARPRQPEPPAAPPADVPAVGRRVRSSS